MDFDHSWQERPGMEKICKSFLPSDLVPLLQQAGIDRSVFVQTQHNTAENRWVLQLAEQHDFIAGVVGWVDLASDQCEEQLSEFKEHPKFVGVRHVTHDEPDANYIVRDEVIRGLSILQRHGVPFDLLFYVKHLHHAERLARELPDLPMVIDHLSKPEIRVGKMDPWRDHFAAAARYENVYCKLSGMITEADWQSWQPSQLKPYVETAVELFGPNRLMYGSDWPVCELAGTYQQQIDALHECLGKLSSSETAAIFGGTATKFYGLAAHKNI